MSVVYLTAPNNDFEDLYLNVRNLEKRVFTDKQVAALPDLPKEHPLYHEWQLRGKSAQRFRRYLISQNRPLKILEIGCGNGWFSNLMSTVANTEITALDVNRTELEQANRIFSRPNLTIVYADIFENNRLQDETFDLIVLNSSLQYFENVATLFSRIFGMVGIGGEIHIIDTPFYNPDQVQSARTRTESYYTNLGFPEMAQCYFHQQWDNLPPHKICYKPSLFSKLLNNDSPFCWISINKQ